MVNLYIKQKVFSVGDRYKIYDEQQRVIFQCKNKVFSWGSKIKMLDSSDNLVYFIKQKVKFSLYKKYKIEDCNGNLICTIKQKSLFSPKLVILMADGSDEFEIKGNFFAHEFKILNDKIQIGSVNKKYLAWGDTYELNISNEFNCALFAAFVIVVDDMIHNNKNN